MTKKNYLETLKSVLGRSILHYRGFRNVGALSDVFTYDLQLVYLVF